MSDQNTLLQPEIASYLQTLTSTPNQALHQLGEATSESVPRGHMRISLEQAQLMQVLLQLHGAKRVLEIGMFTGYSALAMALAIPEDGQLVTCDCDMTHYELALQYWQDAGVAHKINPLEGRADQLLNEYLTKMHYQAYFDWVFIDADKISYPDYVDKCLPLLKIGGVMALDNTLDFGGQYVHRKDSDAARIMNDLNLSLKDNPRLSTSTLPIGGGLTIAYKR